MKNKAWINSKVVCEILCYYEDTPWDKPIIRYREDTLKNVLNSNKHDDDWKIAWERTIWQLKTGVIKLEAKVDILKEIYEE